MSLDVVVIVVFWKACCLVFLFACQFGPSVVQQKRVQTNCAVSVLFWRRFGTVAFLVFLLGRCVTVDHFPHSIPNPKSAALQKFPPPAPRTGF